MLKPSDADGVTSQPLGGGIEDVAALPLFISTIYLA